MLVARRNLLAEKGRRDIADRVLWLEDGAAGGRRSPRGCGRIAPRLKPRGGRRKAMQGPAFEIEILARGDVAARTREEAEAKVRRVARTAPRPVLFARVTLTEHENPATERPSSAKASLDVSGRLVRAHVAAQTMPAAVDLLVDRLERRLRILADHLNDRRPATAEPGEWRHGALPLAGPSREQRPAGERELVEQKRYEVGAVTPAEAALELELLAHDFYLFENAETGRDAVLHRRNGRLEVLGEAPELTVEEARERLEASGEPFLFFAQPGGRGRVLYHRYDGHYGLITPT
ncbi:MAG: sigma 54 modulation/S30EA ribosomal C-terminal domain-containing protein [Thermoleophilia bacterium]|nr:sigma 54 modulation/S30EA ribosomal C-terminal domain-containing protein [Thermoleophilia bacterium]